MNIPFYNTRGFIVLVEVVYLLILFALALIFLTNQHPFNLTIPATLGALPIGVPWFGALGAVIISLSGAFDHRDDWDASWNLWHLTRPFIGVSLAIISWLIFVAGILAVGQSAVMQSGGAAPQAERPANLLYYLIAFVVGYREEIFRDLIKRVADVILTPSTRPSASGAAPPVISSLSPTTGASTGGAAVTIAGTGLTGATSVKFGATAASSFHVNSDRQITATAPSGTGAVNVTVTTSAGSSTGGPFTYT